MERGNGFLSDEELEFPDLLEGVENMMVSVVYYDKDAEDLAFRGFDASDLIEYDNNDYDEAVSARDEIAQSNFEIIMQEQAVLDPEMGEEYFLDLQEVIHGFEFIDTGEVLIRDDESLKGEVWSENGLVEGTRDTEFENDMPRVLEITHEAIPLFHFDRLKNFRKGKMKFLKILAETLADKDKKGELDNW